MDNYIARQPILDKNGKLIAYELLYHDSTSIYNRHDSRIANAIVEFFNELDNSNILDGKNAFITFTPNLLMQNIPRIFDEKKLVIQIGDNVLVHPVARLIIQRYKKQGYRLALSGFEFNNRYLGILSMIDILKIDFSDPEQKVIQTQVDMARKFGKQVGAYNVNSPEAYKKAQELQCDYIQGENVADMVTSKVHRMDHLQSNFFRLMAAVTRDEPDLDEISQIISLDVTLTFSLIKMVNSAYFALPNRVKDIKQALTIMGLGQLRQWIYLMSFNPDSGMSSEIIRISFLRATFCQDLAQLAPDFPLSRSEAYLLGMFSTLDTLLEVPMEEVVKEPPISEEIKNGLVSREGKAGTLLNLCIAYEKGNWSKTDTYANELGIPNNDIARKYLEAVEVVNTTWNDLMSPFLENDRENLRNQAKNQK